MKKKLQLGSQVDINASFDGGADDTSVTYSVPADQQDILSVNSSGVVEALAVGTATVEVSDAASGELLRAIVFQVLNAADFDVQKDLDTGVTEFTAEFAEVPVAPPPSVQISLNTMLSASESGFLAFGDVLPHTPPYRAFDADPASVSVAYAPDSNTFQTIGQVLPAAKVLTSYTLTTRRQANYPAAWEIQGSANTTDGSNGSWVTIGSVSGQVWDTVAPTYQQPEGVTYFMPPNGIEVATKTFNVVNSTAYKAYRLRLTYSGQNGIYNFHGLVFTGY